MNTITERMQLVLDLREGKERKTYKQIAEHLGVSIGRAQEIYRKAAIYRRHNAYKSKRDSDQYLPPRALNGLNNLGIATKREALKAFQSGELLKLRNFGRKSYEEVAKWLGIELPAKKRKLCPHCGKEIK